MVLDNLTSSSVLHRMIGEQMFLEPQLTFAEASSSDISKNYNLMVSFHTF